MIKLIAFITLLSFSSFAQEPTIVYGESTLPNKKTDSVLLVQPEDAPNPLGDPIVYEPTTENTSSTSSVEDTQKSINQDKPITNEISQTLEQDPKPFSITPQSLQNQIENTLYQSGDRIYDIQSYPIKDINEITEPNIQPTITTYPEY